MPLWKGNQPLGFTPLSRYIFDVVWILWRHILRVHVGPFVFATLTLMFIFLLQFLMKSLDQLVGKGLSTAVIIELIVLSLAWMVVLAVPMGVLVATLMAFGGLASSNQVTAMRASGISLYRMMAPVVLSAVIVCGLLVTFNNHVLPDANHKIAVLSRDISRKKPTLSITPGLFTPLMQGHNILVRKTFEKSNDLEGVTIFNYSRSTSTTTITARTGTISFSPDYSKLIMDLRDGEIHEIRTLPSTQYRKIRFEKHRISLDAEGFEFQRSQESAFTRGDREMSAMAMQVTVDSLRALQNMTFGRIKYLAGLHTDGLLNPVKTAPPPASNPLTDISSQLGSLRNSLENEYMTVQYWGSDIRRYLVEIHKKYAIPVACIVFVLVGAPLGIMARRGTFGVGASLSLGFFLVYWACLIGGEKLADRGLLEPWFGMWMANILIGLLGSYLTFRTARENITIDLSIFARLVPKSWRSQPAPGDAP